MPWIRALEVMTVPSDSIQHQIVNELSTWPGVTLKPHRFGGVEFRLGRRELGHIHGNWLVDLPFPVPLREQLVAEGRAEPHHVIPRSGWVSYHIRDKGDVASVIALFRLNYERLGAAGRERPAGVEHADRSGDGS